jgi:hypothetical protein
MGYVKIPVSLIYVVLTFSARILCDPECGQFNLQF